MFFLPRACIPAPAGGPKPSEFYGQGSMAKAQQLLKESGYDGKPIVVMRPTDFTIPIHKMPLVLHLRARPVSR